MAGATIDQAQQVAAGGAPGVAMIGSNTRVRGSAGFLGTQMDMLSFASGATGQWVMANTRVRIAGVFSVSASAQGTAVLPGPPPAPVPVTVLQGDPRIRST